VIVRNNQKGFTLLELVFVIILVGILATAAIARYISLAKEAERVVVENTISNLSEALNIFTTKQLVSNQTITAQNPLTGLCLRRCRRFQLSCGVLGISERKCFKRQLGRGHIPAESNTDTGFYLGRDAVDYFCRE